ncbi:MAG: thymidylate kinase [Wendovervirus sonii]|uniref:Thymidylate kinase n=1 Tax=phage Lak_Megaphage_Sonny TaxID=3109229 RepID=A0ABZ0Z2S3_9CAUD|nr:MAG: thymidylate kinase [phage Lak_Megaphage_Sonny]
MLQDKLIVINLMGGPGTGKSTTAAGIFNKLKKMGVDCELATEYAKDKVWEENYKILSDQIYVFGKQQHRLYRLKDKVKIAITDSPLLLSIIYDQSNNEFLKKLVLDVFNSYENINFYIQRNVDYVEEGRCQNAAEAVIVDDKCIKLMEENNIGYQLTTSTDAEDDIIDYIKQNILASI